MLTQNNNNLDPFTHNIQGSKIDGFNIAMDRMVKTIIIISIILVVSAASFAFMKNLTQFHFFINNQDNKIEAVSSMVDVSGSMPELNKFEHAKTTMINDAILFQQYNALSGATVSQALAGGIIHSNDFWTKKNGYYIYTARPVQFYRHQPESTYRVKMDILCSLSMPAELKCINHDDAPDDIKKATAGKYSVLLYFKDKASR